MDDKTNHERARSRIRHAMTIAEELAESRDRPTFDAAHFVTRVSGCEMHLSEARDLCLELTSLESMRGTRQALDALTTKLRAQFAEELERALAEREARGAHSRRAKKPPALRALEAPCMECGQPLRAAEGTTCNACKDLGVDK